MLQANPFTTWVLLFSWIALVVVGNYANILRRKIHEKNKHISNLVKGNK